MMDSTVKPDTPSNTTGVSIKVQTRYLERESQPGKSSFAFTYTISITNHRQEAVQLLRRHWIINDQNNRRKEVKGKGVIGRQPTIQPGETFTYSSGAVITTEIGDMRGSYTMQLPDGSLIEVPIPVFVLAPPMMLH